MDELKNKTVDELETKWDELEELFAEYGVPAEIVQDRVMPLVKESAMAILREIINDFTTYLNEKE